MEVHLKLTGVILVILGLVHIIFPKYFKWKDELKRVSLINKQMMYVHTFFIALVLILMGVLCIDSSHELITTKLGGRISFGLSLFWIARLVIQFFGYSPELWRGKRTESIIHVLFILLWTYISTVFGLVYFYFSSLH